MKTESLSLASETLIASGLAITEQGSALSTGAKRLSIFLFLSTKASFEISHDLSKVCIHAKDKSTAVGAGVLFFSGSTGAIEREIKESKPD